MRFLLSILLLIPFVTQSQVVYETKDIDKASFVCYVTDNPYEADWHIFINDWRRYAVSNHGNWFWTKDKGETYYWIYFTENKTEGCERNRIVYFVDNRYDVMFDRPSKRKIKKKQEACK